jgi:hypothetical protein
MRYVLLFLVLAAALVIVACSGTTLFFTAFNSAKEPWQQWLQGSGMAAVVAWEAGAILVIGLCFKARYWVTGIGAMVLLVLAMAVTTRQDLRLYVGGQADVTASKSVVADDRNRVRAELDRAYSRRDTLQQFDRLTKLQNAELSEVRVRIKDLEKRWDTRTENVSSSGNAEGELAYLLFGAPVALSQTLLDTVNMWFWMFARVFAIPAAAVAIQALWAGRKPRTAAKAPEVVPAQAVVPMPLSVRSRAALEPRKDVLAIMAGTGSSPQPPRPDDTPPPADAKPVVEEQEVAATDHFRDATKMVVEERHLPNHPRIVVNNDREGNDDFPEKYRGKKAKGPSAQSHARQSASVRKWLGMCSTENHKKTCANSDDVWEAYTAWLHATGEHGFAYRKHMIAELGRIYFKGGRNGRTSRNAKGPKFPGLVPYHPSATPLRATA